MPRTLVSRVLAVAVAFLTGGLALAAQAQALTQQPVWKCRASAGYTTVNGGDRAEAVVANGSVNTARGQDPDHALCGRDESGGGNLPAPLGIPTDLLSTSSASAVTTIEPELGAANEQRVGALGRVENLALQFPGAAAANLGVTFAEATATGVCGDGAPQMTGTSRVTALSLNGSPVDSGALAQRLTNALASLNPLVDVKQDETIRTADALTVRALHIVVRLGSGAVVDTIVAEAKVGFDGAVCSPGPPTGRKSPCARGTVYDADRNVCFIPAGAGGSKFGEIIVGRPFAGPSGAGSYLPVDVARRRPYGNSPCLRGNDPKAAFIGTGKSDVISGSKRPERIIALGGSDRVVAAGASDCIDGGTGNDNLSGDVGNDRLVGGTGNDVLNGGPGSDRIDAGRGNDHIVAGSGDDRIDGGRGNDTINAGFGRDRVSAGPGNDAVNIATAGRAASANCGGGHDTVRFNANERKRVHGCERRGD